MLHQPVALREMPKTVIGIPIAMNCSEPILIESGGKKHGCQHLWIRQEQFGRIIP